MTGASNTLLSRLGLVASLALLAACGAMDSAGGSLNPTSDTTTSSDSGVPFDTRPASDTSAADTATAADTSTPRDTEEVGPSTPTTVKDDPDYIVPADVAERRHVAVGAGLAAWVQRPTPGATPRLAVWDPGEVDIPPRLFAVPNLSAPRQLAVAAGQLVYVDDRYGDSDLFALDLESGAERPIVALYGAQEAPTVRGTEVAWEDCRACVSGDDSAGREIYRVDLATAGPATNLTNDGVEDRAPVFGTLASGEGALAWVHADRTLRVVGGAAGATDVAWNVDEDIAGVALAEGLLAWRAQPYILNPDSMYPADVFVTAVADGATFGASSRAEQLGAIDPVPRGAGGRFAWLESKPLTPDVSVLRLVTAVNQQEVGGLEIDGIVDGLDLGAEVAAFVAPRTDNGGLHDVWFYPIPPTP